MNITLSLAFAVFNHVLGNYGPTQLPFWGFFRLTGIVNMDPLSGLVTV